MIGLRKPSRACGTDLAGARDRPRFLIGFAGQRGAWMHLWRRERAQRRKAGFQKRGQCCHFYDVVNLSEFEQVTGYAPA